MSKTLIATGQSGSNSITIKFQNTSTAQPKTSRKK